MDNIAQTIEQIAVFNEEANQKPLKKRRPYYRASLFFAASTVEAFVYLIIKKYCEDNIIQYKEVEKTKEEIKYCNAWKKIVGKC